MHVCSASPSKPGTPEVLRVGDDDMTLSWDVPLSDGGCPITHYVLERREVRGPGWIRMHKTAVQVSAVCWHCHQPPKR